MELHLKPAFYTELYVSWGSFSSWAGVFQGRRGADQRRSCRVPQCQPLTLSCPPLRAQLTCRQQAGAANQSPPPTLLPAAHVYGRELSGSGMPTLGLATVSSTPASQALLRGHHANAGPGCQLCPGRS
ncbi:hypothetical protein DPEC_G00088270 [Dallia pectoralis]|uniref:Uncharacterized protein n=1 Tax=Dallia pectoralis TaxID=75939 RepID=A0ACC2H0H9_DALPE|nr:hypothetical protein DPEC_G00088270 [Dallia pectoralis]